MVPIIEPDISRDGSHTVERNMEVTEQVLSVVYKALVDHQVYLEGTVLKPSMVTSGNKCAQQAEPDLVAQLTMLGKFHSAPSVWVGSFFKPPQLNLLFMPQYLHLYS